MNGQSLIINVCLTGMVPRKAKVPLLPESPDEIAREAERCYQAGASVFHLHAREESGAPTWRPEVFDDIVGQVRDRCPDAVVIVTTSGREWSELDKRTACLDLPSGHIADMASLTLGSMNFRTSASVNPPDVIRGIVSRCRERGIRLELEAFDLGMVEFSKVLVDEGLLEPPFYFNLLLGNVGTAPLSLTAISAMVNALPAGSTWSLAGLGRHQLAANAIAIAAGGHVRVGLEDNPYLDWAVREPTSNVALVERVVQLATLHGRAVATPTEVRARLGLRQSVAVPVGIH